MLKEEFIFEIKKLNAHNTLAENLWTEIAEKYQEPGRFYHTLNHLDHILQNLREVKHRITHWQTIIFSTAWHDAIYNPHKNDNEERSAELAAERLTKAGCPKEQIEKCKQQILATKTHNQSGDNDTNYFIDADLAILGTPLEQYTAYTENIRKEYSHYPDIVYNEGRKQVLHHFLRMPHIFKTTFFQTKYEEQARTNINNELKRLT